MSHDQQSRIGKGGRITLFHVAIVSLSLALTLGAWRFSIQQVETRTGARFEAARDRAIGLITDRMARYEDALWAGVAAIESHEGAVSYAQWKEFAGNLGIDERYPGINGIGVIRFHDATTLDAYLAEQRLTRPDFRIFPAHDGAEFMPITYIEPDDINAAAVGLDVAHETNRRTAAQASRDTGLARITGPIVLVQDAGKTSGFLFYAPFYEEGRQWDTASRRENALGLVYAPFVVHKLMEGLLAKELRDVRFSIRDGDETIYDEHATDDPRNDPDPMFAERVSINLYGRTWDVDMRSDLAFRAENANAKPTIILIAGLLIETLIVTLLILMSRANGRAVAYADRVTVALREKQAKLIDTNAELSKKNEELERFAYVASHDLKTPIRGINGLTEMIQEDLEDYFSDPKANPDVGLNLERIRDRVLRMERLTNGIMRLSRVTADESDESPLSVQAVLAEMSADFGLEPEQLVLVDEDQMVCCDQVNFQSVLENLVGNAVKYHDGLRKLRLEVSAGMIDDRLHVLVRDNGPGIAPQYHDRIFEVFQTLRSKDAAESTGIGLAIVRKAVERHGGAVWVTSAEGEGATFGFDWPGGPSAMPTEAEKAA
ncbi:MAG: CHASE domain-containing protein [Silicimonas sp.]|nr:CHASE domain-containing protein [Silicimonas sp.]